MVTIIMLIMAAVNFRARIERFLSGFMCVWLAVWCLCKHGMWLIEYRYAIAEAITITFHCACAPSVKLIAISLFCCVINVDRSPLLIRITRLRVVSSTQNVYAHST